MRNQKIKQPTWQTVRNAKYRAKQKGIHEAYEAMERGQDECYCDKCCKRDDEEGTDWRND